MVDDLRSQFSEPEIIELTILVAAMSGFASINVALRIAPDDEELHTFDFSAPVA